LYYYRRLAGWPRTAGHYKPAGWSMLAACGYANSNQQHAQVCSNDSAGTYLLQ